MKVSRRATFIWAALQFSSSSATFCPIASSGIPCKVHAKARQRTHLSTFSAVHCSIGSTSCHGCRDRDRDSIQ